MRCMSLIILPLTHFQRVLTRRLVATTAVTSVTARQTTPATPSTDTAAPVDAIQNGEVQPARSVRTVSFSSNYSCN